MTGDRSAERLRAVVLSALMVFSVFAGSVAFAGAATAATAGNVDISLNAAGNTATVTVTDADLDTDSGSKQSHVVNVQSDSEAVTGTATTDSDTGDGSTQTVQVAPRGLVADRNGDATIDAADFALAGASDESITGISVSGGYYHATIEDSGSPDDGTVETVRYTKLTSVQTDSDTTDSSSTTITTGSPVGDQNGDGVVDRTDLTFYGADDESITGFSLNADGTADVTISDSGGTADSAEPNGGQPERVTYVPAETVTLVETGADTGTFTGTASVDQTDSNGVLYAQDGDHVGAVYWDDGGSTRRSAQTTLSVTDTTAPSVTNVRLAASSGDMTLSFDTDERLGTGASDLAVTVDGPDGATYAFDRTDVTESGSGPYTYTLSTTQAYDDGEGTYTATVDDALDAAGNNGGENGAGSDLGDTHEYGAPKVTNLDFDVDGSGNVKLTFESDEQLSSLAVTVDSPNTGTDWVTFAKSDFTEFDIENGGYYYELSTTQAYDDGEGVYTATVDDAVDANGANGGMNGGGSSLSDTYDTNSPTVESSSVSIVSGPGDESALQVNAFYSSGLLQVQVTDTNGNYELADDGITASTRIKTTVTVSNDNPRALIGNGHNVSWTRTDNGDGTTTVEIAGRPSETDYYFPTPTTWPGDLTATEHRDLSMTFATDSMASFPSDRRDRLDGIVFMTDAQSFAPPRYDTSGPTDAIEFDVSAPHYNASGQLNHGFAEVFIPQSMLDHWGVSASGISGSYNGQSRTTTITEQSGGVLAEVSVHYSSGTAAFTVDGQAPTASAGSDRTVDEGASVSFDGSSSTDNTAVDTYDWDFDGDGTTDATGANPTHVFADPGTYDVTLTVTDGAGNTDSVTLTVTVTDVTAPTAAGGSDRSATAGSSVDFDASGSADNGQIAAYEWDFDGDGTTDATGATPSHTFPSAGTYDVTLTVTDAAGNTATDTVTVTVSAASDSSGGSSGSSEAATVTVTERDGVTNVRVDGGSGTREVDLGAGDGRGVRVDAMSIDTSAGEFTLSVSGHAKPPESVPAPNRTDVGETTAGYLQIDHSVSDEDISGVTITFSVGWDALTSGTTASEVVLYRYHDGAWQPLETTMTGYTETGARFEATSPGLSVFAVGQRKSPDISVEPTRSTDTAAVGESVAVTARVSNDGTATGMTTVGLRVDGAVRDTESVTLDPGQSTTVELATTFDATGRYDLVVEGVDAGSVTVTEADSATTEGTATAEPTATATPTVTATATPTPDEGPEAVASPTATPTDSAGGPGFGAALAVVALLAIALFARRRA